HIDCRVSGRGCISTSRQGKKTRIAMKGDFTRDTFDAAKHYSRVLMQQGRVTLDADANEQTAILLHYMRTLAADLIGPYAAPVAAAGFGLTYDANAGDLIIGAGRYYV